MILSIIVCVKNEENTLQKVMQRILDVDLGMNWEKDIIIVDNLSTDGTHEILKQYENNKNISIIYNKVDQGKSYSVRKAIPFCKGDLIIPQDADLEYHPKEFTKMIKKLYDENLDVVIGSRVRRGERYHAYKLNELGIKFLTLVTNILFFTNYTDVATCYKLMRANLIKSLTLKSNNFDLDFELCSIFKKKKWNVGEIVIDYNSRTFEEGRKMQPFKSGLSALWTIIRERFTA
jgi:glycosyltransferase involved in cell wall biosynthesis